VEDRPSLLATKAKAYSEWPNKPEVIFGDDLAKEIYDNLTNNINDTDK
jgi:hypothetical protein